MGSQTAVASGDRQDQVRRVMRKREAKTRRDRRGCGCPEIHTKTKGKCGPICLPFGEASTRYLYDPSLQRYNVHYTERERGER